MTNIIQNYNHVHLKTNLKLSIFKKSFQKQFIYSCKKVLKNQ